MPKTTPMLIAFTLLIALTTLTSQTQARDFYFDATAGLDSNTGLTPQSPFKSLAKANSLQLKPGDSLLLKRNSTFLGSLRITASGTKTNPITIDAYDQGRTPIINAKGFSSGVHLLNSHHIIVKDLEITADGGNIGKGKGSGNPRKCYGVYIQATVTNKDPRGTSGGSSNITLNNLFIHDIFPPLPSDLDGKNPTTHMGTAITLQGLGDSSTNFLIQNCRIERTGYKAIELRSASNIQVLNNHMTDIGGPAIQPGRVNNLVVRNNTVIRSGSSLDPRMHSRGSGIWPWTCNNVLIEKNTFMHARGKSDSCGIHIDFNCTNVIVQYNLSHDNEGGFIEILGNNFNSAYRYNISINDGARIKGQNGAHQEGKVIWTSGFVGKGNKKHGPINSYIYNNTIYVAPNSRSCFSIAPTTQGLLIANNIFHISGQTLNVSGDQDKRIDKKLGPIKNTFIKNNLYLTNSILPPHLPIRDTHMLIGDPQFITPGSLTPKDYTPQNTTLIRNKGIRIPHLPGDSIGLKPGLIPPTDFLGQPLDNQPDIGAIQIP